MPVTLHALLIVAAAIVPPSLSLDEAVSLAAARHPSVRIARARTRAARESIELAHLAYHPHADLLLQENRGTRNNVSGLLLPQGVIPQVAGPVNPASGVTRFGSALGALFTWEPFDFGLRRARMDVAESESSQARAAEESAALDVASAAADAFLVALAAAETVRAAQATVERMQVLDRTIATLVANQLKAGAEGSRARAELARARTQLAQTEQAAALARAALAEAVGSADRPVSPVAADLLRVMPDQPLTQFVADANPRALAGRAALDVAHARVKATEKTARPRLALQAAAADRGAGFSGDGRPLGGDDGIVPNVGNWAVGFNVTYGLHEASERRARLRVERSNEDAEAARYDQTLESVRKDIVQADALVEGARRVAENTPVQLAAARDAATQSRARYEQGLATVSDVAETEQLLARAEIEDAVARINVWRALLASARARGSLAPWLDAVHRAAGR